jgi:hypothetical protein
MLCFFSQCNAFKEFRLIENVSFPISAFSFLYCLISVILTLDGNHWKYCTNFIDLVRNNKHDLYIQSVHFEDVVRNIAGNLLYK